MTDKNGGNNMLFRFFLLVEIIIGIGFAVYGIIYSNVGYPPPGKPAIPTPIIGQRIPHASPTPQPPDTAHLKHSWTVPSHTDSAQSLMAALEDAIFQQTNVERSNRTTPALKKENGLATAARYHARDMGRNGFFDHRDLNGIGPSLRIGKLHRRYIGEGGENIYMVSGDKGFAPNDLAARIVGGWMNSAGHRANILNKSYDYLGIGCTSITDGSGNTVIYAVQVFGTTSGYLNDDFPGETAPLRQIPITVTITNSVYTAAKSVLLVNLETNVSSGQFQLQVDGSPGKSSGIIEAPASEGVYRLVFHIPYKSDPKTYGIFRGPLFTVKGGN